MGVDGVDSEQNENNSNLSVYGFIGNDGLNSFDYAGLWRIKRDRLLSQNLAILYYALLR
jgi:hypothetical protein